MLQLNRTFLLSGLLLLFSQGALSDSGEQYKYCFKVSFTDNQQIESATVKGYDHPWWKLFRPREIHSATFTDYAQKKCWKSELPEIGIGMSYTLKEPQGSAIEFRCRRAPDEMAQYKAKTWNLYIRAKKHDENYPIDCEIK
jgi:hypothetical protein